MLTTKSAPHIADRRIKFRLLGGSWRNSWRNSDQTLESRDGCSKRGGDRMAEGITSKTVHFPEGKLVVEIPQEDDAITAEEIQDSWYHVSRASRLLPVHAIK